MARTTIAIAAVLFLGVAGAPLACAAAGIDNGWYVGADAGRSEISPDDLRTIGETDFTDTGVAVHGGYRFARHFAVEATYADLGSFSYTLDTCTGICIPELASLHVEQSGKRVDLTLVGSIPLGDRLDAYARAGVARTEFETSARSLLGTSRSENSEFAGVFGVGMRLDFNTPWSLRLQWDRSRYSEDMKTDVDALWLGVEYRPGSRRP